MSRPRALPSDLKSQRAMTAEERRKLRIQMALAGGAGAALGGASAYAASHALSKTRLGRDFGALPGHRRAEHLVPVAVGLGVGAYGANYMRRRARKRLMEKASSFDPRWRILGSLV